jgi:hypothetical protein
MFNGGFSVDFQSETFVFYFVPLKYEIEANDEMRHTIEQIIRNTVVIKTKLKLNSM